MTTTLLSLRDKLQTAIGDKNQIYAVDYTDAINNATREIYPKLFKPIDDTSLITGNILPPFIWSNSSTLKIYTSPTGTLAKNTTGTYIWNGQSSAKVTADGADDYLYITSNSYPRILDIMDKSIDYKCWAYPEDADDAFLTIYTIKADSTAQTLNTTSSCTAGKHTLLHVVDQEINDDIVEIQFRMRVHTDTKYAYFDAPRAICGSHNLYEYLLPDDLQTGDIAEVWIQTSGYADDVCDDLHPQSWERIYNSKVIDDGTYRYLRLPYLYPIERKLRLIGRCPLEELSADTDTISLDGQKVNLLIAYAAYLLFEMGRQIPSSEDISRLETASAYWWAKYKRELGHHRMSQSRRLNIG